MFHCLHSVTIICSSAVILLPGEHIALACALRSLLRHLRPLALRSGSQADSTNCVASYTLRLPQARLCHSPAVLSSEGYRLTRVSWLPSLFSQPSTGWLLAPQTNPCHPPVQWIRPRRTPRSVLRTRTRQPLGRTGVCQTHQALNLKALYSMRRRWPNRQWVETAQARPSQASATSAVSISQEHHVASDRKQEPSRTVNCVGAASDVHYYLRPLYTRSPVRWVLRDCVRHTLYSTPTHSQDVLSPSCDGRLFLYLHFSDPTHGLAWRVLRKSPAVTQHSTQLSHAQGKSPFLTPHLLSGPLWTCFTPDSASPCAELCAQPNTFIHALPFCIMSYSLPHLHSFPVLPKLHPLAGQWPASLMPLLSLWDVLSASFGSLSGLDSRIGWKLWKRRPLMRRWRSKLR